jgi:hypothetical protein
VADDPPATPNQPTFGGATLRFMKSLIAIAALAVIGAVVYKVLTTEVPIDES